MCAAPTVASADYGRINASSDHYAYLISTDSAWDFMLINTYKVSDNFNIGLDLSYTRMDLSKQRSSQWKDTADAYAGVINYAYTF